MKKLLILSIILLSFLVTEAQNYRLKAGDTFPDIMLRPVVNAPANALDLNNSSSKKFYIINFWGTWCSPCIPEMEALAKLQNKYSQHIQVVGVSDDPVEKLQKFILKEPSKIWLASDTASLLYRMLDLSYVGQSVILSPQKQIIAIVKTDSVNSRLITQLLAGKKINSNAGFKGVKITSGDAFGVDSTISKSFTFRGYMQGQRTMGQSPNQGPFAFRRKSFYNVPLTTIYTAAYKINSPKQLIFEADRKKYDNFEDKSQLYCFDLLVAENEKDSLLSIMQRRLAEVAPLKGRPETRRMQVYLLKTNSGEKINAPLSSAIKSTVSYSGNGYNGEGVLLSEFADDYLTNEFELPVIDQTGLTGRYDITTKNDMRNNANILNAVAKLGLTLEKAEREVKVLVLYEKKP